jgi:hypothetical protein
MELPVSVLMEEFERSKTLRGLLLSTLQALVTQTAQRLYAIVCIPWKSA